MSGAKIFVSKKTPILSFVPRRPVPIDKNTKVFNHKEQVQADVFSRKSITPDLILDSLDSKSQETRSKTHRNSIISHDKLSIPVIQELNPHITETQKTNRLQQWFSRLSSKRKVLVVLCTISLLIVTIISSVLGPVLTIMLRKTVEESSFTNMTATICSKETCIGYETPYRTPMVTVLYPFDSNPSDLSGYAPGLLFGNASVSYSTACYVGTHAITLNGPSTQQYVQIPYVDLSERSFTIEAWLYLSYYSVAADVGIFGQCDSNNICLSVSIRNGRICISFDSMNATNSTLLGSSIIQSSDWFHLTIVYDATIYQQRIYINGQIDGTSQTIVPPFRGTSSSSVTTIGRSLSFAYGISVFHGRIDHFIISSGIVRTTCQIYNDATLTAYFPFDTVATYHDHSVNLFHGISAGLTLISASRVNQGIYFTSNNSYFQSKCFPSIWQYHSPFTFSLWIYVSNQTTGGSLIHISNLQNGNGSHCYDLLALTSSNMLVVQLLQSFTVINSTQGPIISENTWTHIAVVYGRYNGVRIYLNGYLQSISQTTGQLFVQDYSEPHYVTLGNNSPFGTAGSLTCRTGHFPIVSGPFMGAMDDFRVYSRELTTKEICVLANM